jgi:hypothetical protein
VPSRPPGLVVYGADGREEIAVDPIDETVAVRI